jgi:DNA-binding CsgD family transcriptional regulator
MTHHHLAATADLSVLTRVSRWVAPLVSAQGRADALRALQSALKDLVPFKNFMVFEFQQGCAPVLVDSSFARDYLLAHMADYLRGLYQIDPFFALVAEGRAGLFRLGDIAPPDFAGSEYYLRHYKFTDVIDELRYLVPIDATRNVNVYIERETGMHAFSQDESDRLAAVEPVVASAVRAHMAWRESHLPIPPRALRPAFDLRNQIRAIAPGEITAREGDIVELMLKGHSAKSIAAELHIEEGTVTNHKRNIYAKLGIHSQAQLFDRFVRTLSG